MKKIKKSKKFKILKTRKRLPKTNNQKFINWQSKVQTETKK